MSKTICTPSHLLVTGGAGFIGSHFVELALEKGCRVTVVDALTYAGNELNLRHVKDHPRCRFVQCDVNDRTQISVLLESGIDAVVHLAAESHVDNSIASPEACIHSNINGTFSLLEACRHYYERLSADLKTVFRFVYVSTDEVYGALGEDGVFRIDSPFAPNSPYSASKAAGDHLVRAWGKTYGLPVITTHCGNNYGPRQHAEKLIPTVVRTALAGARIPIFGDGKNVREWIYVGDHCHGLWLALTTGALGGIYNFSGHDEVQNITLVKQICALLDTRQPKASGSYGEQIAFVEDRPGHDFRYAIDDSVAKEQLGFSTQHTLEKGLSQTIDWYINHRDRLDVAGQNKK